MTDLARIARQMLGAIPRGTAFGMPIFESPDIPANHVRFIDPVTKQVLGEFDLERLSD